MSGPTSATGSTVVPQARAVVWRALAVVLPYCAVCDVSYVVDGSPLGKGTTFVCVPGRLGDDGPTEGAPRGEIIEWERQRVVGTRLALTPETWTTRIELADADAGGTQVTMTVTHEPVGGNRVVAWLQRRALRRVVRRTVDAELAKVPDHVALLTDAG